MILLMLFTFLGCLGLAELVPEIYVTFHVA